MKTPIREIKPSDLEVGETLVFAEGSETVTVRVTAVTRIGDYYRVDHEYGTAFYPAKRDLYVVDATLTKGSAK